ncbi:hypothetical protein CSUI_002350 [Cystoisospora suis]|uniref:Uncharacterized protein n=1 Tax=Cystoisospora suis TaxID=483139 RepID=A0A2C6L962_9APIC|nr:hypothetical protein CSUI_002350 [Cystoisospora suis]
MNPVHSWDKRRKRSVFPSGIQGVPGFSDEKRGSENEDEGGRGQQLRRSLSNHGDVEGDIHPVFIGETLAWGAGVSGVSKDDWLLVLPSDDQVLLDDLDKPLRFDWRAQVVPLLQTLLSQGTEIHIFCHEDMGAGSREDGKQAQDASPFSFSSFLSHPAMKSSASNVHVYPLSPAFARVLLSATADLGVDSLVLLPGAHVGTTATCTATGSGEDHVAGGDEDRNCLTSRSLLSAALACLAVGGRLVTGIDVGMVDEFEITCMREKGASLSFLTSPLSPKGPHLGKRLNLAAHVIKSVAEGTLYTAPPRGSVSLAEVLRWPQKATQAAASSLLGPAALLPKIRE